MKSRITIFDLKKLQIQKILKESFIQNVFYSRNSYFFKLNCQNLKKEKKFLCISKNLCYFSFKEEGSNFFTKKIKKFTSRKRIEKVELYENGFEIIFYAKIQENSKVETEIQENSKVLTKKEKMKSLSKSERRAFRKSHKSDTSSKLNVECLLKEHPYLKNIPIKDWKNHLNNNNSLKGNIMQNKNNNSINTENDALDHAKRIQVCFNPFNICVYSQNNILLCTLKNESIDLKKLEMKNMQDYAEKEINWDNFLKYLYSKQTEEKNLEDFSSKFLKMYLEYLEKTTEGTLFENKEMSFYLPFKYENNTFDFFKESFFKNFNQEDLKTIKIEYLLSDKIKNIKNFNIKILEYEELIKELYKFKEKVTKKIKEKLSVKERAELSMKNLESNYAEINEKMNLFEEKREDFSKALNILKLNLLENQKEEILKRELNFNVVFKERGNALLSFRDKKKFVYDIFYFSDIHANLKLLYDKKRKIALKIDKTKRFIQQNAFADLSISKTKEKKKKKKYVSKKKVEIKKRVRFFFESYKFLLTSKYIFIGGKDVSENEEIVKKYQKDSLLYFHPTSNGPSVLMMENKNSIKFPFIDNNINKSLGASFIKYISNKSESFCVKAESVSKIKNNEKAKKGAFFINEEKEILFPKIEDIKLTIGFYEKYDRENNSKGNYIYPSFTESSVPFFFHGDTSFGMHEFMQFEYNEEYKEIIEKIMKSEMKEQSKNEILLRKEHLENLIQQTKNFFY